VSTPRDASWIATRARAIGMFLGDSFEKVVHETVALLTSVMHSDLASFETHLLDIKERQTAIENGITALTTQVAELLRRDTQRADELEALRVGREVEQAVRDVTRD
jgi:hypothetical protein